MSTIWLLGRSGATESSGCKLYTCVLREPRACTTCAAHSRAAVSLAAQCICAPTSGASPSLWRDPTASRANGPASSVAQQGSGGAQSGAEATCRTWAWPAAPTVLLLCAESCRRRCLPRSPTLVGRSTLSLRTPLSLLCRPSTCLTRTAAAPSTRASCARRGEAACLMLLLPPSSAIVAAGHNTRCSPRTLQF